jgi:7,8-dihydropterin-6-yl-methyl-4-(beta-D-ribofuranosyl)aminobenzene 5'-phosphate synthase
VDSGSKITIIVDNHSCSPLEAEHGFSALIEYEGRCILFDTGQKNVLFQNSRLLDISLNKCDSLVLSHGHYDHGGNLASLLQANPKLHFYFHPFALSPRFSKNSGSTSYIGLSKESVSAIQNHQKELSHPITEPTKITDHICITGPVSRNTDYEDTGGKFYLDKEGTEIDPIPDDMAIWIATKDGLVVITACSHSGIVNTLNTAKRQSGIQRINSVIGGFHLLNAAEDRLKETADALSRMDIKHIISCHCTGEQANQYFLSKGLSVSQGCTGLELKLASPETPSTLK